MLPLLPRSCSGSTTTARPGGRRLAAIAPQVALLAAVVGRVRRAVLHGWGGGGDARARPRRRSSSRSTRASPTCSRASGVLPEVARLRRRDGDPRAGGACGDPRRREAGSAGAPLAFSRPRRPRRSAAGWAVGARYFYLPSVGLVWAVAEALAAVGPRRARRARGGAAARRRRAGRRSGGRTSSPTTAGSRRRAARSPPVSPPGTTSSTSTAGIKDLDLAVKEDPRWLAGGRACWC